MEALLTILCLIPLTYVSGYLLDLSREGPLDVSPIHITVSPLYRESTQSSVLIDRELTLHWDSSIDAVALFNKEPTTNKPVIKVDTSEYPEGFMQTNVSLGNPEFPGGWAVDSNAEPVPGDHCLPFWIAGYARGDLIHLDCFKIRPTWMEDHKVLMNSLTISQLFVPGTHNSGCYKRGTSLSQKDIGGRYILTQDQDIWSQLVYGIRYLDLRIGCYPTKKSMNSAADRYWINHDLIKVRPLQPSLDQIKAFLLKTKNEVVILDLHRFPVGFAGRATRHKEFVQYLKNELHDFVIPFKEDMPTLEEIWKGTGRLIISYGDNKTVLENDWLWPSISQKWGNKQTVNGLRDYLQMWMGNATYFDGTLWAAMAQLTPAPLDLLYNPKGSLRTMAHNVNGNLTKWAIGSWWNKANIVASDFFLNNDLINVAVAANTKKGTIAKLYTM